MATTTMNAAHHGEMMASVLRHAHALPADLSASRHQPQPDVLELLRLRLMTRFRDLGHAFRKMDKDSSGMLTRDEIEAALIENGIPTRHIESLLRQIDTNMDGLVSFAEFSAGLRPRADAVRLTGHDRFVTNRHVIAPNVAGGQVILNDNLQLSSSGEFRPDAALLPLPSGGGSAAAGQLDSYTSAMSSLIYAKHGLLRDAFRALDTDKNGRLSEDELKRAVRIYNLPIPEAHVKQLYAQMRGRDGQVDYEAFAHALKRKDALGN